jgi:hypothetical protein
MTEEIEYVKRKEAELKLISNIRVDKEYEGYTSEFRSHSDIDYSRVLYSSSARRLTGNTRTWPYRNYLYLFVMNGDFTVSNGLIQSSPNVNEVMYDFQVSRRNASNRNWINPGITFLLSNWKESISELRIAAAHKKSGGKDFTFKGEVGISTDGDETKSNLKVSYETRKVEKSEVMFNVGLDRCAELAFNASDMGFGKRDGYGIYRFDQLEFYLKVEFR